MTAKNLPVSEQPYEKCLKSGAASLSDAELLAVIIRCGTNGSSSTEVAKHVLSKRTGNLLGLYQMSLKELQEVPGIGKVKVYCRAFKADCTDRTPAGSCNAECFFRSRLLYGAASA